VLLLPLRPRIASKNTCSSMPSSNAATSSQVVMLD
jgi:hypothetical protein